MSLILSLYRDPSALESLSSVLTGVSSYVANTLPTSFSMPARGFTSPSSPNFPANSSSPYYYPAAQGSSNPLLGSNQDQLCVLTSGDVVLFSAFDWIETGGAGKNKTQRYGASSWQRKKNVLQRADGRIIHCMQARLKEAISDGLRI